MSHAAAVIETLESRLLLSARALSAGHHVRHSRHIRHHLVMAQAPSGAQIGTISNGSGVGGSTGPTDLPVDPNGGTDSTGDPTAGASVNPGSIDGIDPTATDSGMTTSTDTSPPAAAAAVFSTTPIVAAL